MKLNEPPRNLVLKNPLSCLKLPNSPNFNNNNILYENKKKEEKPINRDINEIKTLLKDMKINEHRTTNFATILYIEENNYEKMPMDSIKLKLRKDFNLNKNMFVNSRNNTPFESDRNLIQSMHASISRNKSFITEIINNKKYVSLNQPKALEYLQKMYGKYTTNINGDITSMASLDSKKCKIDFNDKYNNENNRSEKKKKSKNFIGNKTLRSSSRIKYEEILSDEEEEKIKYLKDNLREIKSNNNHKKFIQNEKITDFFEKSLKSSKFDENKNNFSLSSFIQEIDRSITSLDKSEKIISSYKSKLNDLKIFIQEKDKKIKDFEKEKENVNMAKKQLNTLYEMMGIKLGIIQSTKKHKYYGDFFPKSKNLSLNYKLLFDKKIDNIKKKMSQIHSIKDDILNKNEEISVSVKKIDDVGNGISYTAKNEIKKEISNLMKKMKYDFNGDDFDSIDNNGLIEEIKKKFNEIAQEITEEKEDFD